MAVVKNGMLHIYGGSETFVGSNDYGVANGSITIEDNIHLISINLTTSWDWKTDTVETIMNVTSDPRTGQSPPQVVRGALYQGSAEDYNFYLYGGTTSYLNTTFQGWQNTTPATYSLWAYDDTLRQEWDQFNVGPSEANRSSSGASAEAPDQGLAFYFNGEIDNGSSSATANLMSSVQTVLDGMIVINAEDHNARNLSTSIVVRNRPRIQGQMQYVPSIGEK
ncbi:hypothetical protein OEA41_008929 [Lepraria neglecta]|uniref:Uncharacterized protein n=1 Tax=Lepraria neglecta TaxID=209136 RepID=A0AAD9Z1I6_9LECA|nr:hypothetical protein OEA41_008929 [Lepraria neglecta]